MKNFLLLQTLVLLLFISCNKDDTFYQDNNILATLKNNYNNVKLHKYNFQVQIGTYNDSIFENVAINFERIDSNLRFIYSPSNIDVIFNQSSFDTINKIYTFSKPYNGSVSTFMTINSLNDSIYIEHREGGLGFFLMHKFYLKK